jgi:hypothetical protein
MVISRFQVLVPLKMIIPRLIIARSSIFGFSVVVGGPIILVDGVCANLVLLLTNNPGHAKIDYKT